MNLNKVFIIGNLTRDPESRSLPSGQPITLFGIATNRIWNDQNGQRQQAVEYHNIVVFGRLAEVASQYLSKGKMAFIEGRIQTRTWQAQDGTKRNRTEIIAERLQLGPKTGSGTPTQQTDDTPPANEKSGDNIDTVEYPNATNEQGEINPDEIPF